MLSRGAGRRTEAAGKLPPCPCPPGLHIPCPFVRPCPFPSALPGWARASLHAAPRHGHGLFPAEAGERTARACTAQACTQRAHGERAQREHTHAGRTERACTDGAHAEGARSASVQRERPHGERARRTRKQPWVKFRDQRAPPVPAAALPPVRRIRMPYIRGSSAYMIPCQGHVCAHRRGGRT